MVDLNSQMIVNMIKMLFFSVKVQVIHQENHKKKKDDKVGAPNLGKLPIIPII